MPLHEDEKPRIAQGLASVNHAFDIHGADTAYASAATLALWQAVNTAKQALATTHETDRPSFDVANRTIATVSAIGIFTDADAAASNTQALAQAQFTEDDAALPAGLRGCRGI